MSAESARAHALALTYLHNDQRVVMQQPCYYMVHLLRNGHQMKENWRLCVLDGRIDSNNHATKRLRVGADHHIDRRRSAVLGKETKGCVGESFAKP